jgi:hypothetical protein
MLDQQRDQRAQASLVVGKAPLGAQPRLSESS